MSLSDALERAESARAVARIIEEALYNGGSDVKRDDIRYAMLAIDHLLDDATDVLCNLVDEEAKEEAAHADTKQSAPVVAHRVARKRKRVRS